MMAIPLHRLQKGYTLIEIMVAGTVLGLSVIALSVMLRSTTHLQTESDMRRHASQILGNALEISVFHPRDSAQFIEIRTTCGSGTQTCTIPGAPTCTMQRRVASYANFRVADSVIAPIYEVEIKVHWGIDSLMEKRYITPISFQCDPNAELCRCP
jgi:type II secretory pathway pseudopilin PulG